MPGVIIYGPQACGKTKNAEKFRAHFGCANIVDGAEWPRTKRDWDKFKASNDLLLVTDDGQPHGGEANRRIYSYEEAAAEAGIRQTDMVNHPPHYAETDNGVECIDAIRAALGREQFIGFLRGQVIKYQWRLGKKADSVEDNRKAIWYATKLDEVLNELEA